MDPPAKRRASYEDVLAAPAHQVAEVVEGVLHTFPRPAIPHARASSVLRGDARVRAEPFEALELELGALWAE